MLGIRAKMIVWIVLPALLICGVVAVGALSHLRRMEEGFARTRMTHQASNYARQFDLLLREAAATADASARLLEIQPDPSEEQIYGLLESNVRSNPVIYGSACAFEPGTYKKDDTLYSPYVYRSGAGLGRLNIDRSVYDWYNDPAWQWFRKPKERGVGAWTDPYFDKGAGNALMTTYSAPFFRNGQFRGVVTLDIVLPQLQETLGRDVEPGLDFMVLTKEGRFVYARDTTRIMKQTVFDMINEVGRPDLAAAARHALAGEPGVTFVDGWDRDERQWLFYAPIASTQWTFLSRMPESVVLKDARRRALLLAAALGLTLVLITLAVLLVSERITSPIAGLKRKVMQIAGGDLEARVEVGTSQDEVAQLSRSFNKMADDLRIHIDRIAEQDAARSRVEHELDLAKSIQVRLLPSVPPNIPGYDIAGWSRPADKTGGDYFDWQQLPDGRLVVSIADASGHGIGPALVTAVCRAYVRASFPSADEMPTLVGRVNHLLAQDLDGSRFVTFAAAVLDSRNHAVDLVSAGHGPQFHISPTHGTVTRYGSHGPPLAIESSTVYEPAQPLRMEPGDVLVLVTDGFFEWVNPDKKMFGTQRLSQILSEAASRPAAEIIQRAYAAVLAHAAGTPQEDDLTAVVIKRVGTSSESAGGSPSPQSDPAGR